MKTVICADIHLDGSFPVYAKDPERLALRRQETRETFSRVIEKVQETGAELLLIAGDLFDANHVTGDTVEFIKQCFLSIPKTYVLISPGNNDPATSISPYKTEKWPENVYIFTRELEAVELLLPESKEQVRIYGAGFRSRLTKAPLLDEEHLPELDPAYINILLMHASLKEGSSCNPLSAELLDRSGFDFCALGHEHISSSVVATGNTFYAYPGACEERDFPKDLQTSEAAIPAQDLPKRGGILSGVIGHKYQELTFTELSYRRHICASLDITCMTEPHQIESAIRTNFPANQNLYRITLTGIPHPMLHLSLKTLSASLKSDYFYICLRACLNADFSGREPLRTGLLRDYFLSEAQLCKTLGSADPETLRLAVQYGLYALDGTEAPNEIWAREEFGDNED